MIKRQRTIAIILAVCVVVMIPLYIFVIEPLTKALIENANQNSDREIMYVQTERTNIQSIEVKNDHGTYKFVYIKELDKFVIDGHELAGYDATLFSQLVVDCGYTLSKATVENENAEKLSEYGLDDASDPAYYILTNKEGTQYKVLIGDKIVSGGGYYARMDGENKVYILDTTLETTVLSPIEAFITPTIVFPTGLTTYFNIKDFAIFKGAYVPEGEDFGADDKEKDESEKAPADSGSQSASDSTPATQDESGEQNGEDNKENGAPKIETIVRFHYLGQQELGAFGSNATFSMDYPGDGIYTPSGYLDSVLQMFIAYQGSETVKLSPSTEDLEKFGLLAESEYSIYLINYSTGKDENGKQVDIPVTNRVYFSKVQKDETTGEKFRYAHSLYYDETLMIFNNIVVKIPDYNCAYLEYDLNTWIASQLFSTVIGTVSSMQIQTPTDDITFTLTGEGTGLIATEANGHKPDITNFKKFYQTILSMEKGGYVALSDEEVAELVSKPENLTLTLTVKLRNGNQIVYKFYSYGVQTYYTVNGDGMFYLPTSQVSKVIADAIRVTKDEIVYSDNPF